MSARKRLAAPALLVGALMASGAARADSAAGWVEGRYMTGDWGGLRTALAEDGISPRAHYVSELAANPSGGLRQGVRNAQQFDFGADLDLDRLNVITGGRLHVTFTQRAGRSLAADDIGNLISVQEIYGGGQNFRLAELSFDETLWNGVVYTKVGWTHAADDFAHSPIYCYFQNNGFCGQPAGIPISSGFTTFPVGSWGGLVKVAPARGVYLQAGAYEVNPTLATSGNGFKLSTSGATGAIVPVEVGWHPTLGAQALPGNYKIGGYYDTSRTADLGASASAFRSTDHGRMGVYLLADQMVYRAAPGTDRGLTLFGVFVAADPETALVEYYWEAGLLYRGAIPGRDRDTIGLAVNQSRFSSQLADAQRAAAMPLQDAETDLELNYRAEIAGWFTLMPNIQYVIDPNGRTSPRDALVLGLQAALTF